MIRNEPVSLIQSVVQGIVKSSVSTALTTDIKASPKTLVKSGRCKLWYDGKDSSTFSLNGDKIIQCDDKSGFDKHISNAVDANRPTYNPATGGMTFVNANSTYLSSTTITLTQPNTIYIICRSTNITGVNRTFFDGITSRQLLIHGFAGGGWQFYAGTAAVDNVAVDTDLHVFAIEFNGAASYLWVDGVTNGPFNPGANGLTDFVLGANNTLGNCADGEVKEAFAYDCSLISDEHLALLNYANLKWEL